MAYQDSDHTTILTQINVLVLIKAHLGGGDTSAFVFLLAAIARALSSALLPVQLLQRVQKDSYHTAVIADAKTQRAGEIVSTVFISCLRYGRHC